jgi:hypothetical protein
MSVRVLYYALGGGLGHLVRAGRFLQQQGLAADALILSASAHAGVSQHSSGVAVREVPPALQHDLAALRDWLARCIDEFAPQRICVDCFPAGLLGELADLPAMQGVERWLVARLLNRAACTQLLIEVPRFAVAWRMESLHPEHEAWLQANAEEVRNGRPLPPSAVVPRPPHGAPFWLVAHSGPAAEVQELIDYARALRRCEGSELAIAVASLDPPPQLAEDCFLLDPLALPDHYAAAERIVCAAGFNTLLETEAWCGKRHVLPFPRRHDDQFARAARASQATRPLAQPT